jgi:hypothetical protein
MFLLGMLCLRLPSVHSDFGFAIRTYRTPRNLPSLTPELREVIVGCRALGDLSIANPKATWNAYLQFAPAQSTGSIFFIFIHL